MGQCQVLGRRVRFREEEGPRQSGVPMVLLHMAGGGSSVFGPAVAGLGRFCRVLAPDFPGHGQSEPLPADVTPLADVEGAGPRMCALAGWTLRFLDEMGLGRVVLAGHSMGGAVALTVALAAPDRVAALGLVCTSGTLRLAPGTLALIKADFEGFRAQFTGAAAARGTSSEGHSRLRPVFPQAPRETVLSDFEAADAFDVTAQLRRIGAPTLVVSGDQDLLTPLPQCQRLAAAIPGATLVVVGGTGHLLPRENPTALVAALSNLCGV